MKNSVTVNGNFELQFRHPIAKDASGKYGRIIRKGLKKFDSKERGVIVHDLEQLIGMKAESLEKLEQPEIYHEKALEFYFDCIDEFTAIEKLMTEAKNPLLSRDGMNAFFLEIIAKKDSEIKFLRTTIKTMQTKLGLASEAEQALTLSECLESFKKAFLAKTAAATRKVVSNVKLVLTAIGIESKHSEITKQAIDTAIESLKDTKGNSYSDGSRLYQTKNIKTFFEFLTRPVNEGGLALTSNPAKNLKLPTVKIAMSEQAELIDGKAVIALPNLTLQEKAILALEAFAGLRLSEVTGIQIKDIDWNLPTAERIIRVRTNDIRKTLKTKDSFREIKPFGNLWPILEQYKNEECKDSKDDDLLFYKDSSKKLSYVQTINGNTNSGDLGANLTAKVKAAGINFDCKLNFGLRHYWTTQVNLSGFSAHESIMGGHSKAISQKNYLNKMEVIRSLDMPTI